MVTFPSNYLGDSVTLVYLNSGQHERSASGLYSVILDNATVYNLILGIGFILTSLSLLYLLLNERRIYKTGRMILIIWAIFILSPIRLRYVMEWPNHANWAWVIFYLASLFEFLKRPFSGKIRYAVLSGIFFSIALLQNSYHGVELFFISIPLFIFAIYSYRQHLNQKKNFILFLEGTGIVAIIMLSSIFYQYWIFNRPVQYGNNDPTTVITSASRSTSDRWAFSARPWHFLIPDIDHPVLGDLAVKAHYFIWQNPPYYLTEPFFPKEHTLFLGYTLMALSAYAIFQTYFRKRITGDKRFAVTFFLIIAVTGFIFSMPPYLTINDFKIYFPSHFIYDFLPQFRAYARYGVMVFIGNTIIALIGLEYLISISFTNYSRRKTLQNLLLIGISALAIFEFLPGYHLISTKPTPPYEWLREQALLQPAPLKYIEIPERADYTDHLYTHNANIEILNPYLISRGNAKLLEDIIWQRKNSIIPEDQAEKDKLFCLTFQNLGVQYIFYHKKDVNKQKVVDEFKETGIVKPQLKVALAESWGQPVWGNHVPKTEEDLKKDQRALDMEMLLRNDPKFTVVKEFTNEEIIASRPNPNFSADKFDAVTIFEISNEYCNKIAK